MKKTIYSLLILGISIIAGIEISAQCVPDTAGCQDIGNPGEFCPKILPQAIVNQEYNAIITVIAPGMAVVNQTTIKIEYIIVDSVLNLPPGMEYSANAAQFYPDSAYCISVTGTPTTAGDYPLAIYVTPYIFLVNAIYPGPQVVDDTSVVVTVQGASGLDPFAISEFQVLQNIPNPFSEVTRIGFYTPFDDKIELKVYSILGELMHEEIQGYPPGEYYFRFDGGGLLPGTYFYRITNSSEHFTGKFIKSR